MPGFSPLDEELALLPGQLSPSLHEAVVRLGSWIPFRRVPQECRAFLRTTVSAETARRLTEAAGAALVRAEDATVDQRARDLSEPPEGPVLQQLSADGAMVPLRHGVWAEVKTLAIGRVEPSEPTKGAATTRTTVTAYFSRLADAARFGYLATYATHAAGTSRAGTVCAVVDGAPWLQEFIDLHRPDAVRILDFPHAAEHLGQAAEATFGAGNPAAATWLTQQCHELKHGDPEQVLASVANLAPPTPAGSQRVTQVYRYLANRREQIADATFRAAGYPIGDGMVESANKLVVEARLKGSGMHWVRANVNPMVALRAAVCSDQWDVAWGLLTRERRHSQAERGRHRRAARAGLASPPVIPPPPPPRVARSKPSESRLVVNGKPTAEHPWRRFRLPIAPLPSGRKMLRRTLRAASTRKNPSTLLE